MITRYFRVLSVFAVLPVAVLLCAAVAHATTPACIIGPKGVAPVANITFTPPTTNTDGTPIVGTLTYDLYQGTSLGSLQLVASDLKGSPVAVKTGLTDGTTVYWDLTAVSSSGTQSAPSNVVCKTFPAGIPNTVVISIS